MGHKMALRYIVFAFVLSSVGSEDLPVECSSEPEPTQSICIDVRYFENVDPSVKKNLFALSGMHPELPPISLIEEENELVKVGMNPVQSSGMAPALLPIHRMAPEPSIISSETSPTMRSAKSSPEDDMDDTKAYGMGPGRFPRRYPGGYGGGYGGGYPGGYGGGYEGMYPSPGAELASGIASLATAGLDMLLGGALRDGSPIDVSPTNNTHDPTLLLQNRSQNDHNKLKATLEALQNSGSTPKTKSSRKNDLQHLNKTSRKHGYLKDSPIGHRKTVMVYHQLPPL